MNHTSFLAVTNFFYFLKIILILISKISLVWKLISGLHDCEKVLTPHQIRNCLVWCSISSATYTEDSMEYTSVVQFHECKPKETCHAFLYDTMTCEWRHNNILQPLKRSFKTSYFELHKNEALLIIIDLFHHS